MCTEGTRWIAKMGVRRIQQWRQWQCHVVEFLHAAIRVFELQGTARGAQAPSHIQWHHPLWKLGHPAQQSYWIKYGNFNLVQKQYWVTAHCTYLSTVCISCQSKKSKCWFLSQDDEESQFNLGIYLLIKISFNFFPQTKMCDALTRKMKLNLNYS